MSIENEQFKWDLGAFLVGFVITAMLIIAVCA